MITGTVERRAQDGREGRAVLAVRQAEIEQHDIDPSPPQALPPESQPLNMLQPEPSRRGPQQLRDTARVAGVALDQQNGERPELAIRLAGAE